MSDENDRRLAKLYMLMEDGEWREECMGIVILSAVDVNLHYSDSYVGRSRSCHRNL